MCVCMYMYSERCLWFFSQSLHGSSVGDVSVMDSDASSVQQPAIPATWVHSDSGPTRTGQLNEMQLLPNRANCSSAAAYIYDGTAATVVERVSESVATGEDRYKLSSTHQSASESFRGPETHATTRDIMCEGSYDQGLENCGVLAFMSSANSVTSSTLVCANSSLMKPDSSQAINLRDASAVYFKQTGAGCNQDIESCGTLAFMSSANSITSIDVPAERQITRGDGGEHASTVACANRSLVQADVMTQRDFSVYLSPKSDRTETADSETVCGGRVPPPTSTTNAVLQEKVYDAPSKRSGSTEDLKALERELSPLHQQLSAGKGTSSVAAVHGFPNPLCPEEDDSRLVGSGLPFTLRPAHVAQQSFPPLIQVSLTSQPPHQV